MVDDDPTVSNPQHYRVLWENERVRVLEYADEPGASTTPHRHPDSVMVTLTAFRRRLEVGDRSTEVELPAGRAVWIPAQSHAGTNIGDTPTHTILVELKDPTGGPAEGLGGASGEASDAPLGPVVPADRVSHV